MFDQISCIFLDNSQTTQTIALIFFVVDSHLSLICLYYWQESFWFFDAAADADEFFVCAENWQFFSVFFVQ